MKLKFTLICFGLLFSSALIAQTNVPALITSNQTWDPSGSPYLISQNTYLDSGVVLRIKPGTEVRSSNAQNKIYINGDFQAMGTASSPIELNLIQFEFNKNAVQYDASSGKGARLAYCNFTGNLASSTRAVNLKVTDILIENCQFKHCFYGVYGIGSGTDTLNAFIDKCTFIDSANRTYPLYFSGTGANVSLINSTINGGSGVTLNGRVNIEKNTVNDVRYYFNIYGEGRVHCNKFKGLRDGIEIRTLNSMKNPRIIFTSNTLDSCGASKTSPMLLFRNFTSPIDLSNVQFSYNNFLRTNNPNKQKVVIYGNNSDPTTFESINFKHNYWNSTDTNTIDSFIQDYNDDITIFAKADADSFQSSRLTNCKIPTCNANFYVAIDTSSKYNLYLVHNSTGTGPSTNYKWTFGDGDSSDNANPTHQYSKFGLYEVCLTIWDTTTNCFSRYCDSVGLDSNGKLLKAEGFTIKVIDEDDLLSVPSSNTIYGFNLYPNPASDILNVDIALRTSSETQIVVYNIEGQKLIDENRFVRAGESMLQIDLNELGNGMYIVQLKTEAGSISKRLMVNKQ